MTTIKPKYPKDLFEEPYINGLWNGIIIGFGIVFMVSGVNIMSGAILLMVGIMYYWLWNRK